MRIVSKNFARALIAGLLAGTAFTTAQAAPSGLLITEWMYNPSGTGIAGSNLGEFVEFTNFNSTAIDATGWSFDDDSRTPGSESLSAYGLIAPGESVIFTDASASAFRAAWNLSSNVKVIGNNVDNLGRADEINLFNNAGVLMDRLTYNDQGSGNAKGPRTSGVSASATLSSVLGTNNASKWALSVVGDGNGAYASAYGDIGSPGKTSFITPVPEPDTYALMIAGLGLLGCATRRKKKSS